MSYRALYRVWRPQTFGDLIGQEHVTQTLKNALEKGHFSHAYLFSGPRGTGKTSAAKIMAKAVNCLQGPASEPCNECDACLKITEGSLMDVVEIDAASNRGVDEIRDLRDKVKYAPAEVRYKVYIVDEVHMLTTEAFNALLKTLEEPPGHVLFILATTEPHKLPSTIISRCQRFAFRRIAMNRIAEGLQRICDAQGIEADAPALAAIAQVADGGMRDALSLLDQVLAFSGDHVDESAVLAVTGSVSRSLLGNLLRSLLKGDAAQALDQVDQFSEEGLEAERLLQDLIHLTRDLLVWLAAPDLDEIKEKMAGEPHLADLSQAGSVSAFQSMLEVLIQAQQQIKWVSHPRILVEMTVIQLSGLSQPDSPAPNAENQELESLKKRIRVLEQKLESRVAQTRIPGSQPREEPAPLPDKKVTPGTRSGKPTKVPALDRFLNESSAESLQQVRQQWPEILARVKEQKITVHAWLIDGEPVAATPNSILVSFKSGIHRQTTDKTANKSMIQEVMEKVLGSPQELVTIMKDEWVQRQGDMETSASVEETPQHPNHSSPDDDAVRRAVELFGKDMVEVTD